MAIFPAARLSKLLGLPSIDKGMQRVHCGYMMEDYSAMKKRDPVIRRTVDEMGGKVAQPQNRKHHTLPLTCGIQVLFLKVTKVKGMLFGKHKESRIREKGE